MMRSFVCLASVAVFVSSCCHVRAFSLAAVSASRQQRQRPEPTTTLHLFSSSSRRSFVHDALSLVGGVSLSSVVTTTASPQPAHAAATTVDALSTTLALRSLYQCQKKLSNMELYVVNDEYQSLKEALRAEPFSDLRKNCSSLIRTAAGTANESVLAERYKSMIAKLEKMDGLASLASRGRVLGENEFYKSYNEMVVALTDFVQAAKEATAPPAAEAAAVAEPTAAV